MNMHKRAYMYVYLAWEQAADITTEFTEDRVIVFRKKFPENVGPSWSMLVLENSRFNRVCQCFMNRVATAVFCCRRSVIPFR